MSARVLIAGAGSRLPMPLAERLEEDAGGAARVVCGEELARACAKPPSGVRKLVLVSTGHVYGCHPDDPAYFTEAMRLARPPRTPVEAAARDAEAGVGELGARRPDITVTVLRFADGVGRDVRGPLAELLALPAIPAILGFDPRLQVIHEDDVAGCVTHAVRRDLPGTFNCAGDGVLALSEVAGLLGRPLAPVLPPVATGLARAALARLGLPMPPETLAQLRFGRALDNRLLKARGYRYRYTSREAILRLVEH